MMRKRAIFIFDDHFWTNRFLGISFVFQERVADPSSKPAHFAARPNLSPYPPPMIPMDYDDGIPYRGWILSLKIFKLVLIAQRFRDVLC